MKYFLPASILCLSLLCSCSSKVEQKEELISIQITDQNGLSETISAQNKLSRYIDVDFTAQQPYKKVLRVYKKDIQGKCHSVLTSYYPNGQIEQYLECISITAQGKYKKWHQNGSVNIEANIIGGPADFSPLAQKGWLFEGISKVYDENQALVAKITYKKGELNGLSIYYFPDQTIKETAYFSNGQIEGIKKTYQKMGIVLEEESYSNGIKQGISKGYFSDEKIAFEEEYKDDLLQKASYYNQESQIIASIEKGKGEKIYFHPNCEIQSIVTYQNGAEEGLVKSFTRSGELQHSFHQTKSKKQGKETLYYLKAEGAEKEAQEKLVLFWDDDSVHGSAKTFYLNGKQESQREFSRNKKNGMSFAWFENGDLMFMEEYENDTLVKGSYYEKGASDPISKVHEGTGIATLFEKEGTFLRKVRYKKGEPLE